MFSLLNNNKKLKFIKKKNFNFTHHLLKNKSNWNKTLGIKNNNKKSSFKKQIFKNEGKSIHMIHHIPQDGFNKALDYNNTNLALIQNQSFGGISHVVNSEKHLERRKMSDEESNNALLEQIRSIVRAEVKPINDRLDGLSAYVRRLNVRVSKMGRRMGRRFLRLEFRLNDLDSRFKELDTRFNDLDTRFKGLDSRLNDLDSRFNELDTRFNELDTRFNELDTRFNELDTRLDELEETVDEASERVEALRDRVVRLEGFVLPQPQQPNNVAAAAGQANGNANGDVQMDGA